ncbi:hypothetical protein DN069_09575 [Streptacidiphilus pinicola]|uniref:ParB-like N-terminal domain-containing protein n=1 Tax=Streptacidiphilus pinicola TaxID=2219663 RepID=A0A2X0IRB8_9ACTN|nr:ParB/RepB/Spo0J family partition protein [Streptacidiphilus pinicola]RAG85751.1 hypothetical protein DN069_09575 [Streptacidiphilus pinicola]
MTPAPKRVTRGFEIDEHGQARDPGPRPVRTRQEIIKGVRRTAPQRVELSRLAHNPFNPRDQLTGVEEVADSLRVRGQVQPVTVVGRAAFLQAHPGQEEQLGAADYVVIDGNRRLAAAGHAGLADLRVDVNDDLAASAADILESALVANIHRMDVPPLDQAKAIEELVRAHGSQSAVARRLGKTPAWVSQRLALLQLTPELQDLVQAGGLNVEAARRIGRLPRTDQAQAAERDLRSGARKVRRHRKQPDADAESPTATLPEPAQAEPGRHNGDAHREPDAERSLNAVNAVHAGVLGRRPPSEIADLIASAYSKQELLVVVARLLAILQDFPGTLGEA